MQNNSLIRVFGILFALVSIYQLSFTFIASNVENQADIFAEQTISEDVPNYLEVRDQRAIAYLDSIGNNSLYGFTTYNDAKDKELNKGLDLKGGINVILQISIRDILSGLAENTRNPIFNKALDEADILQKSTDDPYIESFFNAFDAVKSGEKLASPDIFANRTLSDEINFDMTDQETQVVVRRKIDESIVSAFEVLRKRIDKFGVTQPNIQRLGTSGRILVELPGAKDVERVQNLLQSTAQLEFWETYKNDELITFLVEANQYLKTTNDKSKAVVEEEKDDASEIDDLLADVSAQDSISASGSNPILDRIVGQGFQGGPVLAQFASRDSELILDYLNQPQVRKLLPSEYRYIQFAWGKPVANSDVVELYALKSNRDNLAPLSGGVVVDALQTFDQVGNAAVSMQMDSRGARIWESMTGKAFKEASNIAIVLDDIVYSAPGVSSGPIAGGRSEITGNFTLNEAIDLANVLRAGKLPASAEIIQSEIVGPSLGQEAIEAGIYSFIIALIFVLGWMIFYYGSSGIYADIALILNILLIFGILAGLGAVLTLPGIAGVVLTIGISVDANVLIFERVREELSKGKGIRKAIADGFNNALSSILDANITTGLTALILFIFGTGPIKGFATTLLIGIGTSLFTAIFITRILVDSRNEKGKDVSFSTKATKGLLSNINISFLQRRKVAYIVSSILILVSLASLTFQGLNQGVDFVGGRSYTVRFEQPVNPTEIGAVLSNEFGSAEAKTFGEDNQLKITTKYKVDVEGIAVDEEIQNKLFTALQSYLPDGMSYDNFVNGSSQKEIGIMSSIKVGPTIADDIKSNSFLAVIGSLIVVFLYILLRFQKWQFSLGAVVAVFHDVLIVLGIFSITYTFMPFSMEINQAFIAAILTVIGYSLNDTVVVFDRIREFLAEHTKWEFNTTVDAALNSTLSRTLNTSLTTLIVLLAIFIFGGESIRGFMFALIIGVLVGTYSSVFIATPVMYDTQKKKALEQK
ncbi:protein translocase subunit SecDF [Flavobacteriaceae bacterium]|jgi:SecD/SecF fusion protein|nr:protein translocase subunit SecDF [Flavobacteriaceae bacterium]MBT4313271.1 protein translocase subunit SecDF [Flavobacteriaceae bacterium]MBT5091282.1 protein translocase subunit SecDF [Flavobacteriaceae bacterium]MBT5284139.1 protein translocase subunit SecDF [Flavobacteriaceae bacterium]MBT5445795.1 protein translocase subunit SecDF [Flavobacteriaceae bacterium]|tara:strand:- start:13109 stop:16066 length:2958 start_codon:yes stop_codon:yes gene_type:complete